MWLVHNENLFKSQLSESIINLSFQSITMTAPVSLPRGTMDNTCGRRIRIQYIYFGDSYGSYNYNNIISVVNITSILVLKYVQNNRFLINDA